MDITIKTKIVSSLEKVFTDKEPAPLPKMAEIPAAPVAPAAAPAAPAVPELLPLQEEDVPHAEDVKEDDFFDDIFKIFNKRD